jgi:hypothetical protein
MQREPRREEHTICTAVAPEAVFTVRTQATTAPDEPEFSAHFSAQSEENPQVNAPLPGRAQNRGPSQDALAVQQAVGGVVAEWGDLVAGEYPA